MVKKDSTPSTTDRGWRGYWDTTEGRPPRATLLHALDLFEAAGEVGGVAVDLGCGIGRDSLELARRGWRVVAVDAEAEALERLAARLPPDAAVTVMARLETYTPPPARFVNASFSLFFMGAAEFGPLWRRIVECLEPCGRFAGQLLGARDDWVKSGRCLGHGRDELNRLLEGWTVERCDEEESDGITPRGEAKHWHVWHLVLRRPSWRPDGFPDP